MKKSETMSKIGNSLRKNKNPIMIGLAATGIVGSDILLVRGTVRAVRKIDAKKKAEHKERLTNKEILKTVWMEYWAPIGMTFASFLSIIFAMKDEHGKAVTSAIACTMSEAAMREYKDKVVETIGARKEQEVLDAVSKEKVAEVVTPNTTIYSTNHGSVLFLDPITKRLFESDMETIRRSVNVLNRRMMSEMRISLNEFYMELDLDTVEYGDEIGWNIDRGLIDIYPSTQLTKDNRPCIVLNHNVRPEYNY